MIDDTRAHLDRGHRRVLIQAPTGAGKTHVIAAMTAAAVAAGLRVLILATRVRIVRQIHERLDSFAIPHGVIAAPLPRLRWSAALVQVASVDTLSRRAIADERMPLPPAEVVIFDEAHLALGESRVSLLEQYPEAVHLGFTATPAKISGRPLRERFDTLVLGPSVRELIEARQLVRPRIYAAPVVAETELAAIRKDSKTGDFAVGELGEVMSRPKLVGDVWQNWLRIAPGRRTLIFATNKAHGAALLGEGLRAGIAAEMLTDEHSDTEREEAIARLERGETLVLVNCFLLSYGIDIPSVECVVLARPTRSVVLYLQAIGRGMRQAEGKEHVLVIDHGRVVESLGFPTDDFAWSLEDGNVNRLARAATAKRREASIERPRVCPECSHTWLVSDEGPSCTACGWAPPPRARAIETVDADLQEVGASRASVVPSDAAPYFAEALSWYARRWPDRWQANPNKGRFWAWIQTREAFELTGDRMPSHFWRLQPAPCSPETAGRLLASVIRYAKRRAFA